MLDHIMEMGCMRKFSLEEPATLFWRDMEKLEYRPDYRYFSRLQEAIVWAFEDLSADHRWSAYVRLESDHAQIGIPDLEQIYQSIKSS